MNFKLLKPLYYIQVQEAPEKMTENEEFLLCYSLDSAQSRSIEPEKGLFPGFLEFIGRKFPENFLKTREIGVLEGSQGQVDLPAGHYLFVQKRACVPLGPEEWLDLAIEQQKDGLWERNKLENRLYVRYLFEDGRFVTQLFRPVGQKL